MRILFLLVLLFAAPAWAQTGNEWRYLASRQEAQAVLAEKARAPGYTRPRVPGERTVMTALFHAEYDQWRRGLEAQLRTIIGPVTIPAGYPREGRLNIDLCCYQRTEAVDGLRFEDRPGDVIVVTTKDLLRHWRLAHRDFKAATDDPTADPNFYQWTGVSEGAVRKLRDLGDGVFLADPDWIAMTRIHDQRVAILFVRARTNSPEAEAKTLSELLTDR